MELMMEVQPASMVWDVPSLGRRATMGTFT
jgi:hypothetical protein